MIKLINFIKKLVELIRNKNQFNFVIVTSGAVGLGATKLNYKSRPKSLKGFRWHQQLVKLN